VNLNLAVVFDEAQSSEAIHEKIHSGTGVLRNNLCRSQPA
jgi:hypothetical protein